MCVVLYFDRYDAFVSHFRIVAFMLHNFHYLPPCFQSNLELIRPWHVSGDVFATLLQDQILRECVGLGAAAITCRCVHPVHWPKAPDSQTDLLFLLLYSLLYSCTALDLAQLSFSFSFDFEMTFECLVGSGITPPFFFFFLFFWGEEQIPIGYIFLFHLITFSGLKISRRLSVLLLYRGSSNTREYQQSGIIPSK